MLIASLLCGVVAAFVFMDGPVQKSLQRDLGAIREFFGMLTYLGSSSWVLWGCGLLVIVLSAINWTDLSVRARRIASDVFSDALFAFATVALSGILISLIKNTLGRARPRYFEELGPFHFEFAAFDSGFASFPSGHSTTFGATAMVLALLFPRGWPVFVIFGLAGGISRAVVGAHYISDIIAGLMCGAVFTLLVARWLARKNLMFRCGPHEVFPVRRRSLALK